MLSTFPTTAPEENNLIQCDADQGFISWLSQAGGSVAITTYQAGKLALVGWNGEQVGMLKFTTGCQELYNVQFLAGVQRPMVFNQERKEIRQAFTAPNFNYCLRPSAVIPND
ncbi:hypothetical protein [Nostoc sp.]|uniref:hypothetical protein n=1 Tax=Nostoc sp. TaxID=1180 RepID=UPI002FF8C99E